MLVLYSALPPKVFVPLLFLISILSFKFFGILFCEAQLTCTVRNILQTQTTCFFFERQCYRRRGKKVFDNFDDFLPFLVSVQPRISLNLGPRYAIQGSTFTLPTCHVTGYPTPVVTWRKLSSHLPLGRVRYNNSALQILRVRKEDSEFYICSAENLLGKVERKTLLVVVSLPRFTSKPPPKIVSMFSSAVSLNCSATGDPQPIISWGKHGGQLPVGRSQQINGALVITNLQQSDAGNYICTATSAGVFDVEAVTTLEIQGTMVTLENYCIIYDDDQNLRIMSCALSLNFDSFQGLRQEKLLKFTQNAREIIPLFQTFRLFDWLLLISCLPNSRD